MQLYVLLLLLFTAAMLILHVFEWRDVLRLSGRLRAGGSGPSAEARRLRWAIFVEAAYYVLLVVFIFASPGVLNSWLVAFLTVYHWGGAALGEMSGAMRSWSAGDEVNWSTGAAATFRLIALLDAAEMLILAYFLWVFAKVALGH